MTGRAGFLSFGCGVTDRWALSNSGGSVKASGPMHSTSSSEMNSIGSLPFSLPSGMFIVLKLDLRDLFSVLSTRSNNVWFCTWRDLIVALAVVRCSKFSPTMFSVAVRWVWHELTVSRRAYSAAWSGFQDSWIKQETSFSPALCFASSATSCYMEMLSASVASWAGILTLAASLSADAASGNLAESLLAKLALARLTAACSPEFFWFFAHFEVRICWMSVWEAVIVCRKVLRFN